MFQRGVIAAAGINPVLLAGVLELVGKAHVNFAESAILPFTSAGVTQGVAFFQSRDGGGQSLADRPATLRVDQFAAGFLDGDGNVKAGFAVTAAVG